MKATRATVMVLAN